MRIQTANAALISILIVAGCNTDPAWEPDQRAEGPTTRIDRPEGIDLPDLQIADAREVDMVERVLMHRAMYHRSLAALREYYRETGYETKRIWAANELRDVSRIKPYRYIVAGEIPGNTLRPIESISAADDLFARGETLMLEGGHSVPGLFRKQKMREALTLFKELIESYPTSDKIDDAAFFCGEIHKEYFKGDEEIAVRWYERAFTWNPDIQRPARFQAAAVYDLRLHDRDRALELYRGVVEHENFNRSNVSFALHRIDQLTWEKESSTSDAIESAETFAPAREP